MFYLLRGDYRLVILADYSFFFKGGFPNWGRSMEVPILVFYRISWYIKWEPILGNAHIRSKGCAF